MAIRRALAVVSVKVTGKSLIIRGMACRLITVSQARTAQQIPPGPGQANLYRQPAARALATNPARP